MPDPTPFHVLTSMATIAVLGAAGWLMARRTFGPGGWTARSLTRHAAVAVLGSASPSVGALHRRCFVRMCDRVEPWVSGAPVVPAVFTLELDPSDAAVVEAVRDWFCDELAAAMIERAGTEGWRILVPTVSVCICVSDRALPGAPIVTGHFSTADVEPTRRSPHRTDRLHPAAVLGDDTHETTCALEDTFTETVPVPAEITPVPLLVGATGTWPITGQATVGRDSECTVVVTDQKISRIHANLGVSADGMLTVEDRSRNGTTVDGKRVRGIERVAVGSDIVLAGRVRLEVDRFWPSVDSADLAGIDRA